MDEEMGGIKNTSREKDIIHIFEHDMERFKITLHTIMNYVDRILSTTFKEDRIEKYIELVEKEFKEAKEIKRMKSALIAIKYNESSNYFIYLCNEKAQHGNIYVVNENNIIKTVYLSKDSGWFEQHLKHSKMSPRRRFKYADKYLRGTKRESVHKKKD